MSGSVYVSKSGDDGNTGSASSPVLTLSRANAIASNPRITTIHVDAGTYAEEVQPPRANLTYRASGAAIIDGETSRDGFDVNVSDITVDGFTFVNCVQGVYFRSNATNGRAENCENSASTGRGFYANAATGVRFINCYSHGHTSGYGFEFEASANNGACIRCWSTSGQHAFINKTSENIRFDGCVAFGTTLSGFYSKGGVGMKVYNCVAYDTEYGVYLADDSTADPNSSDADIRNTIIQAQARGIFAVESADTTGLLSDYNDFHDNTLVGVIAAETFTTLANWQAEGYDANSLALNPSFADPTYGGFTLPGGSALLAAGEGGVAMGREGSTWDG